MKNKIKEFIDDIFAEAPANQRTNEMKEEILSNTLDKYDDMIREGKTEQSAYNIAIASIGDVGEIIKQLKASISKENYYSSEEYKAYKGKKAIITPIFVMMYILCVVPILIFQNEFGVILMFCMIAAATGLAIYLDALKPTLKPIGKAINKNDDDEIILNRKNKKIRKIASDLIWSITVLVYFLVSFFTGKWGITWIIFLIAAVLDNIVKSVIELREEN